MIASWAASRVVKAVVGFGNWKAGAPIHITPLPHLHADQRWGRYVPRYLLLTCFCSRLLDTGCGYIRALGPPIPT